MVIFRQNSKILAKTAAAIAFIGLFAAVPPAFSQNFSSSAGNETSAEKLPRIAVEASGSISAKPDMALLQISVSHEAKTAKAAAEQTAAALQTLLTALKSQKIAEKDMQSNGLAVNAVYQEAAKAKREKSFQAAASVTVKIRNTGALGQVIDTALANGANGISDISWTNSDLKPLYAAARRQAVENALDKIRSYAAAAGLSAGRILRIEELSDDSASPRFYSMAKAAPAMAAADMPVAEGEETYSVRISLTAELIAK